MLLPLPVVTRIGRPWWPREMSADVAETASAAQEDLKASKAPKISVQIASICCCSGFSRSWVSDPDEIADRCCEARAIRREPVGVPAIGVFGRVLGSDLHEDSSPNMKIVSASSCEQLLLMTAVDSPSAPTMFLVCGKPLSNSDIETTPLATYS
jgi:hypothetical protein